MALPTTPPIDFAQDQHVIPPFKSAAGNFYAIGLGDGALDQIHAFKAADPSDDGDWVEQDSVGHPDVGTFTIGAIYAVQDGDLVHIVTQHLDDSGHNDVFPVEYHVFDMNDDNWDIANESVDSGPDADEESCVIAVRSDGDVVVGYMDDHTTDMGNPVGRCSFNVRTTGTWSGPTGFTVPEAGASWRIDSCVLGASDRVHFFTSRFTVGVAERSVAHQSLSSADVLDTQDIYDGPNPIVIHGHGVPVAFNDGGTIKVRVPRQLVADGIVKFDSAANPTITQEAAHDNEIFCPTTQFAMGSAAGVIVRRSNGDLHLIYNDQSGRDLFRDVSLGGDGNWGTDIAEDTSGVLGFWVTAAIYDRGGDTVLAYLWEERDAVIEYNEIVLAAVGVNPVPEILGRRRTHHRVHPAA